MLVIARLRLCIFKILINTAKLPIRKVVSVSSPNNNEKELTFVFTFTNPGY